MNSRCVRGAVLLSYGAADLTAVTDALRGAGVQTSHIVLIHHPDGRGSLPKNVGPVGVTFMSPTNTGYGAGMNAGWRRLPSEVTSVLLLTPGVSFDSHHLDQAFTYFEQNPDVGILGPVLRTSEGATLSAGGDLSHSFKPTHKRSPQSTQENPFEPAQWVDGAAMIVRPALLPMPEHYFLYWEDVAFSLSARRSGWRTGTFDRWVAITEPGAGGRQDLFRFLYWRNRILCARELGGPGATLLSVAALLAALVLRPVQKGLNGNFAGARRTMKLLTVALHDGLRGRGGPPRRFVAADSDVRLSEA